MFFYLLLNTRDVVKDLCKSTGIPDCKSIGAGLIQDYKCDHKAAAFFYKYKEQTCCR